MIIISYSQKDAVLERILAQLKDLSLAHKTRANPEINDIQLEDGISRVQGEPAIQKYLEELAGELDQWYYCSC